MKKTILILMMLGLSGCATTGSNGEAEPGFLSKFMHGFSQSYSRNNQAQAPIRCQSYQLGAATQTYCN